MSTLAPCPNCGTPNRKGARFCATCRVSLASPIAARLKTCPHCHKPNRMDARFCASCGHVFRPLPSHSASGGASRWLRARVRGIPLWILTAGMGGVVLGILFFVGLAVARSRNGIQTPTPPPAVEIIPATPLVTSTSVSATLLPNLSPTHLLSPTQEPTRTALPKPTFNATAARERALRATVMIIVALDGQSGQSVSGSGSVISQRGYILTNNHLFYDDNGRPYNTQFEAFIAFPARDDLRSDARIQYRAILVENNPRRDLALIRISSRQDGAALPANLELDTIPIGDSDAVVHGDNLTIVGYPGIGGDSLTLTSGNVSGFLEQEGWIKTDAEINQGNSGGPALNAKYELIGVASAASQADDLDLVGKLGLVRPIRFASGLIERAKRESGE